MVAEFIARVERRRHWPDEEKRRIVSEALAEGVSIAAVADRNGVCRSLVYLWLRLARSGQLPGVSLVEPATGAFVPVRIGPVPLAVPAGCPPGSGAAQDCAQAASLLEVVLRNGRRIKIDAAIDPATLARLVAVLDGGAP